MNNFDIERAKRIIGNIAIEWYSYPETHTDDMHPFGNRDLSFLDTPEKRKEYFREFFSFKGLRRTGSISATIHRNFTIAAIEHFVDLEENRRVIIIQKWLRGMLTRSKYGVHNPNCEIGQAFLKIMFEKNLA